jgi:hypothetical protein
MRQVPQSLRLVPEHHVFHRYPIAPDICAANPLCDSYESKQRLRRRGDICPDLLCSPYSGIAPLAQPARSEHLAPSIHRGPRDVIAGVVREVIATSPGRRLVVTPATDTHLAAPVAFGLCRSQRQPRVGIKIHQAQEAVIGTAKVGVRLRLHPLQHQRQRNGRSGYPDC